MVRHAAGEVRRAPTSELLWLVGSLTLASFAFALALTASDQPRAYFNTGARAWEFLLGLLLAILAERYRPRAQLWGALAWAGLLALVFTGFLVDGARTFPGVETLIPVGGAALVVVAGTHVRWGPSALLARRPIASLGKYAYGFYLWHWPILVLFVYLVGRGPGPYAGVAVLGLAAALAFVTYHLVEQPLRRPAETRKSPRSRAGARHASGQRRAFRPLAAAVAIAGTLILVGATGWQASVVWGRNATTQQLAIADLETYPGALAFLRPAEFGNFPSVAPIPDAATALSDRPAVTQDGCQTNEAGAEVKDCAYGDTDSDRTIALVGSSHATMWAAAVEAFALQEGYLLQPLVKAGCPFAVPDRTVFDVCDEWREGVLETLRAEQPEIVVLISTRPIRPEGNDHVTDDLIGAIERILEHSLVIGIRDTPWLDFNPVECEAQGNSCDVLLADYVSDPNPTDELEFTGAVFLDLNDLVCPDGVCTPVIGNRFVFRDNNHLSNTYVETLGPAVTQRLTEALESLLPPP